MIRILLRIADPTTRRMLRGFLTAAALSTVLAAATLASLIPLLRALFSTDPGTALPLLPVTAGLGLATAALDVFATVRGQRTGARLILCMHEVIAERVARLPLGWFDAERTGPISHLATRGVTFAANAPETILRPVLHALLAPAGVGLAVAVAVDPLIGACMLAGTAAVAVVWRTTRTKGQRLELAVDRTNEEGASGVLEFAAAQPAVRAAGPGSLAERALRGTLRAQRDATERALAARGRGMTLYNAVAYAALLLVTAVAAALVTTGTLDAASFVSVLALQIVTCWFALHGLPFGEGIDLATRTLEQLDELLAQPLPPEPETPASPDDASIHVEEVTFSYIPGTPVIRGASFTVPAGTMTAIIGPSGSGKTTLARLIARFFDVDRGSIRIGGADVRALGTRATLAQVSMVFQDVYLFEDTLRENIRLGRPGATDADVEHAADRAGVTEIADRLPQGFDTMIGESGGTLSGGERQRVSIARALLKDAPIVLLDEATSALDIDSEALIQHGLAELTGHKTLVVIAHRLQTIRHADQIVVLDGTGTVEATGDHDTLLIQSPTYAGFYAERSQAAQWRLGDR